MGRQVKDQLTGQTYNFPDDATDEQISESMASMHPVQAAAAPAQSESDFNKKLIDQPMQDVKNTFGQIKNFADDVSQGVIQAPIKAAQFVARGVGQGLNKFGAPTGALDAISNFPTDDKLAFLGSRNQDGGSQFARSIGETLPYAALGGTSILGQIVSNAAQGAADSKNGKDELLNTLVSGAAAAVPGGAFKLFEKLRPSNVLRGTLTPDELRENLRVAGDSPTGLGNVIGNTRLTRQMENIIGHVPFSGQSQVEEQAKDFVSNQGKNILERTAGTADIEDSAKNIAAKAQNVAEKVIGTKNVAASSQELQDKAKSILDLLSEGKSPETINNDIQDTIGEVFNQRELEKRALYKQSNDIAQSDPNFKMRATDFEKLAPALEDNGLINSILSSNPDLAKTYSKLRGPKNSLAPKNAYPSLEKTNILKAKLNGASNTLRNSPDPTHRFQADFIGRLAGHLDNGISESIASSGNSSLAKAYDIAQKNYGKNFAPLLDRDIYRMIARPGNKFDSDTLTNSIVKTGGISDRGNLASKMQRVLGPRDTRLAASYLSPAINKDTGQINLDTLGNRFNKLGKTQRNTLINDRSLSKSLIDINKKNEIQKIIRPAIQEGGEVNPKTLASIARKQTVPDGVLPKKSKAMLSEYEKAHALHEIFSPAMGPDGKINSAKLDSVITKLQQNPVEFEKRVPDPEMRKRMSDFVKLNRWNSKSQKLNPPTGQKVLDYLPFLMGHMGGAALGGVIGSVPGSIVGALAPATLARPLVRAMTSPAVRQKLVNKMIENKKLFDRPSNVIPAQTLSQSLINSKRGNQ